MALMREGYADFLAAQGPEERLLALGRFRVLCAHRQGPLGSEALSAAFEAPLREDGRPCTGPHYDGRPLIVTENHYALELWNGDLGVVSAALDPGVQPDGRPGPARPSPPSLRAFFPTSSGVLRSLAPARLPAHEPLFAMSVHKSQGSEFDEVLVVLPDRVTRVLSRELLYTAVTRARRRVSIYSGREVLASALGRRVERASGFGELLWGPGVTDA
jgi:exodeoxyribonuclease V alpha subunit